MSALDLVLVGVSAFVASTIAGLSGYGAGLLMPLVLAPVLGAQAVVPVLAVAALFDNGSRLLAKRAIGGSPACRTASSTSAWRWAAGCCSCAGSVVSETDRFAATDRIPRKQSLHHHDLHAWLRTENPIE